MTTPEQMTDQGGESEYLWRPEGARDPEIAGLEDALRPVRLRGAAPDAVSRFSRVGKWGRIAAVLALAGAGVAWVAWPERPSWEVVPIAGSPSVDSSSLVGAARLRRGDWLETDLDSRASVSVADIGSITVEPGSRVRLVASRDGREHRMELAAGSIQAFIVAPPRLFFVDTPSAEAIDMGCIYTLAVKVDRSTELRTSVGLVELAGKESGPISKVPGGAVCRTHPSRGPGTPRFDDAPPALCNALDRFDAGISKDLGAVMENARVRDTLSLWHLLARVEKVEERTTVLSAMARLAGRPAGVSDRDALGLDAQALDAWWSHLRSVW